jgi:lipopolysaccharide transport system permease protein
VAFAQRIEHLERVRVKLNKSEELQRLLHILYYQSVSELKQEIAKKYLGFIWWFLDPVLYRGVFYLLFASGLRGGGSGQDFVWFLFCGLVPWKWFASSLENCSRAITANANLISQVYFPKIILPATVFAAQTFKFLIVLLVLLPALVVVGKLDPAIFPALLALLLLNTVLNFSVGALAAAVVPFLPDLKQVISYSTIFLFFLSGIFFDVEQLSPEVAQWLRLNPMLTMIAYYRHLLLGLPIPEIASLNIVLAECAIMILLTLFIYRRYDRIFPRLVV